MSGYVINPTAIPVAILEVSGIMSVTKNVGNASSNCFQFMFASPPNMKLPTIINTGAVIAPNDAIASTTGKKKRETTNKSATTTVVNPLRPPAATPEDDSIYALDGVEPNIAPAVVATASAVSAARTRGNFPPFIKPACSATPIIVPVVSKIVTSKYARTTV